MTSPSMPYGYYDRFDAANQYEKNLFIAGAGLQSAELNEVQDYATQRITNIANAVFKDGDIIRDAAIVVDVETGAVKAQSGAVYVAGNVRGIVPREFTIDTTGTVLVGVYLIQTVVTALEDPELLDPATGTRNYQQPGAARLKIEAVWGWFGERNDVEFYPVYEITDGVLKSKEPPPNLDSVTQAIARYDLDSTGGSYVVSGLTPKLLPDLADGRQTYSVSEGKARVNGQSIEFATATRVVVEPTPDLRFIDAEPHTSSSVGAQRVDLDLYPVSNITEVRITAQKTVTMTHGAYSGVADQIADSSVLTILSVVQGTKTYVQGTDYKLTAGQVDWSLSGAEPATGSTYSVTYQYITPVTPTLVDTKGCTVTGAVVGSLILVSYNQAMPRIDRICVTDQGQITYVKGVSANFNPAAPDLPKTMLPLALVNQTWDSSRSIIADGVRVVPMTDLAAIGSKIDYVLGLVAQQQLVQDINFREAGAKKGLFTDPFLDDSQRDQGIEQTAAIFDGILTLPVNASFDRVDSRVAGAVSFLPKTDVISIQQTSRTGFALINPYLAFGVLPANVTLLPAVDRWTDYQTVWQSPITQTVTIGAGNRVSTSVSSSTALLKTTSTLEENLRQISVSFNISGFGPNENLMQVTFDGIDVTASVTA
jgi:hypothetical protein